MAAQIALQRLYALLHPHHRHRAIGARHHAAFAADAAALIHAPDRIFPADSALGADVGAGRIFTLAAKRRRREFVIFHHADPRRKAHGGNARTVLVPLMGYHAGDFTGTAADALLRIRDNKPVHPCSTGDKNAECQKKPLPRLDPEWSQRRFLSDARDNLVICLTLPARKSPVRGKSPLPYRAAA